MQVISDADEHGAAVLGVLMKATVKVSTPCCLLIVATGGRLEKPPGLSPSIGSETDMSSSHSVALADCAIRITLFFWVYTRFLAKKCTSILRTEVLKLQYSTLYE